MGTTDFYVNTPLWMPVALCIITIVLFVCVISLGAGIYKENKEINTFKNEKN